MLLASCNKPGFQAISIRPIDGWVDGCNAILISGSGFGDDVTAMIGDQAVTSITLPAKDSVDYGYQMFGVAPPSTIGKGYQDVTVTSGGKTDTITGSGAYYYKDCPGPGYIEGISQTEGLSSGTAVTITGCGLDSESLKVRVVDSGNVAVGADLSLTKTCGTAVVNFSAPSVPTDGTYYLELVDPDGNVLVGTPCPPPDTADTAGGSCVDYPLIYGAAQ